MLAGSGPCTGEVIGRVGKWAERIPGGSSPHVRDTGPSSVPSQSSQWVRWHHHAGSAAGRGGASWSQREHGRDEDAEREGEKKKIGRDGKRKKLLFLKITSKFLTDFCNQQNSTSKWLLTKFALACGHLKYYTVLLILYFLHIIWPILLYPTF